MLGELFNRFGMENIKFMTSKNGGGIRLIPPDKAHPLGFTEAVLSFFEKLLKP